MICDGNCGYVSETLCDSDCYDGVGCN
jgi:hypothetical protein